MSAVRRGDAWVTTVPRLPHRDGGGTVEVMAHDDGGVTLLARDHRGEETARISFMRETWASVVSAGRADAVRL